MPIRKDDPDLEQRVEEAMDFARQLEREELGDAAWVLDDPVALENVMAIWRETATDEEKLDGLPAMAELKTLTEFYLTDHGPA